MTRILVAAASAALAALLAVPAPATPQETCVHWGPSLPDVPTGVCIPVDCPACDITGLPR